MDADAHWAARDRDVVWHGFTQMAGGAVLRVGTLTKTPGSLGGFVAGPVRCIELLENRARPCVFTTAPTPADMDAGLWVPAIRPPTVLPGTSRLRVTQSAGHSPEEVDRLAAELDGLGLAPADRSACAGASGWNAGSPGRTAATNAGSRAVRGFATGGADGAA